MEKNQTSIVNPNRRLFIILLSVAFLLLLPVIAMQFTQEVKWTLSDFIIAGILLFSTAFILEFMLRKIKTIKARVIACAILFLVFFLIWAELAVGIFGTPFAGS